MPTYDFKCIECQEVKEHFFPIQQGPPKAIMCDCGKESYQVIPATPAHLKGGGWGGQ